MVDGAGGDSSAGNARHGDGCRRYPGRRGWDLTRFRNPRDPMSHLGLAPSEHSSGATIRRSGLTKTGNAEARRVMVEAAWTYRLPARVGRILLDRPEGLPVEIRDIAWKAQVRLCACYRRLPPKVSRSRSSWPRSPANCWASPGHRPSGRHREGHLTGSDLAVGLSARAQRFERLERTPCAKRISLAFGRISLCPQEWESRAVPNRRTTGLSASASWRHRGCRP
jgi:hypothetical protein